MQSPFTDNVPPSPIVSARTLEEAPWLSEAAGLLPAIQMELSSDTNLSESYSISDDDRSFRPNLPSLSEAGLHQSGYSSQDSPHRSMLLGPIIPQHMYDGPLGMPDLPSGIFTGFDFQTNPYGPSSRRTPNIFVDTTALEPRMLQVPSDAIRTPYEPFSSPFSRRPSLTTPSSSNSILPITPPMNHLASPQLTYSPHSPTSPSAMNSSLELTSCDTGGRNIPAQVDMRTVPQIAATWATPMDGPLIPQKTYRPHTQSDRRRYVEDVDLEPPIVFYVQHPDGCGISLRDALNSKFMRLCGRDDLMFSNRGPSVSIRLMWPGYAPWSRQIPTRDFRSPPGPITRSKLAKNVAKTIQRFIEEVDGRQMEDDADTRWRVGRNSINLDDLILVGLQHVSMGSWQAHLHLRHPL